MELIKVDPSGEYAKYEELTLQKEELEKEAEGCNITYIKEFGELITKAFELKIDCIALKKEISLYVAAKNSGKKITEAEVAQYLEKHMTAYREELKRMVRQNDEAGRAERVAAADVAKIRAVYRRLAKLLHPDISPLTEIYPNLAELFNRVLIAYKCNDLKELQKLEVLINRELEENGGERTEIVIHDISERIAELEEDINRIVTTEPYTYRAILEDSEAVEKKKEDLSTEITEYEEYKKTLTEKLAEIKAEEENG